MYRKVDYKEQTRKLNELREQHSTNSYVYSEMHDMLTGIGFSKSIAATLMKGFPFEKIGNAKLYSFPKTPIHQQFVTNLYKRQTSKAITQRLNKTEALTEKAALELLKSKDYVIKKAGEFDLERFKREQPEMYKKYLKYEYV